MSTKPKIIAPSARYDAAGQGRRLSKWNPPSSGPNTEIVSALTPVRNRARDSGRNDSWAAAAVRTWANAIIGSGIVARAVSDDPAQKQRLTGAWDSWCDVADADGVSDLYGLETLACTSLVESGETFARLRWRRPEDGLPAALQVQLLEPDFVPHDLERTLENGNVIKAGIELDKLGRRVAYWCHRKHPGERSADINLDDLARVPAEQMIHLFMPTRPGQLRGISWLAGVLVRLRTLGDFEDAVLTRQQLGNLFAGFIKRPMPTGDATIDPMTGKTVEADGDGVPMVGLEPGVMQELLPGEEVEFTSPPDAGANYGDFVRSQLMAVASGLGIPLEVLTGDVRDISDRSLRITLNEFRRLVEARQWFFITRFLKPIRAAWADGAIIAGSIKAEDVDAARTAEWSPPRWRFSHATQDIAAIRAEVDAGFRSRSSVIAEMGYDPLQVDTERAEDAKRETSLGLAAEAAK